MTREASDYLKATTYSQKYLGTSRSQLYNEVTLIIRPRVRRDVTIWYYADIQHVRCRSALEV
jgi:hypothetical protein